MSLTRHLFLLAAFSFQFFFTNVSGGGEAQNRLLFSVAPATDHQVTLATVAETDGGAYYTWLDSNTTTPVLSQANLGAGKIVLHPRGFALPHFADTYKIGFVIQGSCSVGIILPDGKAKEHILTINKGEIIPVPLGAVSWWYNPETAGGGDVEIIFLGETSNTYNPSQFDYFLFAGKNSYLQGFSTNFISQSLGLDEYTSEKLLKSQTGTLIVKLTEEQQPGIITAAAAAVNDDIKNIMTYNLENAKPFIQVNRGGSLAIADADNVDCLKGYRRPLSASLLKLEANSMAGPIANVDGSSQVFYLVEGGGRVQLSGLNGENALNATLEKGDLFVVPRFFTAALMADGDGLLCFSVFTSSRASYLKMSGKKSVWEALSPSVLQASFNVDLDIVKLIKSKLQNDFITPPNH